MKKRIVIAGFGDTGLLVAIHLGSGVEITGISPKPCLVSGQELGARLTQPDAWKQDYLMSFGRYPKLDGTRILQGRITRIDTAAQQVHVKLADGGSSVEPYDALVIASGVTNGFWRNDAIETEGGISGDIDAAASRIAAAESVAVIGGGATGVSVAANLAEQDPGKAVHLFFSQEEPLPGYHPKVRRQIEEHLRRAGVQLHPDHRASVPEGFQCDRFTNDPVQWTTGQSAFRADLTLWAVGSQKPNSAFVPDDMKTADGFVKADEYLRVPGYENVFVVGDVAASDPHRSSARNWGYRLVAHNIQVHLDGREGAMKRYAPPRFRWGSILGVQRSGLRVFQPDGGSFRFPRWLVRTLLFPIAVRRVIYKGIRSVTARDA